VALHSQERPNQEVFDVDVMPAAAGARGLV
jgi:hypothetical protein